MSKTWLITGASSGFGLALAERVASSGHHVIAVARRGERLKELASKHAGHVSAMTLDLTSSQTGPLVQAAIRDAGGLDVLVNNAGYGLIGSVEQCNDAAVRAQFDVNFFAPLTVLRAALPALRLSQGRVVQILSFFSELAVPGSGLYSASKSALALASQALALELAPSGVQVTTVHPGRFGTEFLSSAHIVAPDETYANTVGATISRETALPAETSQDPSLVVDAVLAVVMHPRPPRRLAVGDDSVELVRNALQTRANELAEWGTAGGLAF
jgi:short-subunit dehydrogenase